MYYKSNIDNLKSFLRPINSRQIAEAIVLTINKLSSNCVVTKEESTSTLKWSDIFAGRRTILRDFKS